MTTPLVSVIMPSFNAEAYVTKAVTSDLEQTVSDLEILIADDCSTDATVATVKRLDEPRVRLLEGTRNEGPAAARNRALAQATGAWVAFLDADDWWAPTRLERLLAAATEHGADMVADSLLLVADETTATPTDYFRQRGLCLEAPRVFGLSEFIEVQVGLQPVLRRSVLTGAQLRFDESLRHGEDNLLWIECLLAGARLLLVPEGYYYYRRTAQSLTRDQAIAYDQARQLAERLLQDPRLAGDAQIATELRRRRVHFGRQAAKQRALDLLKRRQFGAAAAQLLLHPGVALLALGRATRRTGPRPPASAAGPKE